MSIDTVSDLPRRVQYTATAAQDEFDYPFPIFVEADLVVDVDGVTQALNTDYTVAGETEDAGGTITFTTPMSGGEIVTIYSELTIERTTDFQQNGPLASANFNDELDRLIIICQELRDKVNRSVRLPMTTQATSADTEISPVATWANKYLAFDSDSVPTPAALVSGTLTQAIIAALSDPQTDAEDNASITPNTIYPSLPYDLRRAGLVPNDTGARAANSAALKALLDPDADGPTGWLVSPNTTGSDVYYFGVNNIEIRDGVALDLQGCTWDFAGSYSASMDLQGFLMAIRDVVIENGSINVDYDGSSGTNNGMTIRLGARGAYSFGSFGGEEEDLTVLMGNIRLSNLRITSNNPAVFMIGMLGGIHNTTLDNLVLDGDATALYGISYEFGQWHYVGGAGGDDNISAHAMNLVFKNIRISNLATGGENFSVVGAMSVSVDGIWIDGGGVGIQVRPGEALYYNVAPYNTGHRAHYDFRRVFITDTASTAMSLLGAELASGGYLATDIGALDPGPEAAAQTDLISFAMDGFSIEGTTSFSGRSLLLKNGIIYDGTSSGGILLLDELRTFHFENVQVLDSAGIGIRSQTSTNIYSTARLKSGTLLNCFIAGSDSHGLTLDNCDGVYVGRCRFGRTAAHDGEAEGSQDSAVTVGTNGFGVVLDGNYVTTFGGAAAYTLAGNGDRGCDIRAPRGLATFTGNFMVDGVARETSTSIADISHNINTVGKYTGKKVYDTSNTRMLVAQGAATNSTWITVADFGAGDAVVTVTPS